MQNGHNIKENGVSLKWISSSIIYWVQRHKYLPVDTCEFLGNSGANLGTRWKLFTANRYKIDNGRKPGMKVTKSESMK